MILFLPRQQGLLHGNCKLIPLVVL